TRGNRLDVLPLSLGEKPHRVRCERRTTTAVPEQESEVLKVAFEAVAAYVGELEHVPFGSARPLPVKWRRGTELARSPAPRSRRFLGLFYRRAIMPPVP